jgi:2-enoate reductase
LPDEYGAKIVSQMTAGFGRVGRGAIANPAWAIAPSRQPCFWNPSAIARELSVDEIERLIKAFGAAALTVKMAGFDGIELHAHEGYLIDQFLTAKWNERTDRYGGNLEGRLRFPLEIIESIRKSAGPDFPLIFRMAGRHYIEGGREIEESIHMAKRFEEAGVDCLHVDAGCYDAWNWAHPPLYMEPGVSLDCAAAVKKEVSIPVIAVGRLGYPALAEKVLSEGQADFIALGRPLLADPEWPNKVKAGRLGDIRPCIGDHDGCMGRIMMEGRHLSCTVNPQTGRERDFAIQPASQKKSIVVIGGGPAGMEAAIVARLRGHKVTLWEKEERMGGHLIAASVPGFNADIKNLITYLSGQVKKLGVQVKLNKEIPGIENKSVTTSTDLLLGKKRAGREVVVVGGGVHGCEAALWLAQKGKKVTVLEVSPDVLRDSFPSNKLQLTQMMAESGIKTMTGVKVLEITDKSLTVEDGKGKQTLAADTMVIATGFQPERSLADRLVGRRFPVHIIGDCSAPGKLLNAIWGPFRLGLRL